MQALITIRNRPRVSSMSGMVTIAKIGLMIALSTPKINATINRVRTWLVVLEPCEGDATQDPRRDRQRGRVGQQPQNPPHVIDSPMNRKFSDRAPLIGGRARRHALQSPSEEDVSGSRARSARRGSVADRLGGSGTRPQPR